MTPARLLHCLSALRWSASGVAIWCGYARQSGVDWTTGRLSVPPQVAEWMELAMQDLAPLQAPAHAWMAAHPAPQRG